MAASVRTVVQGTAWWAGVTWPTLDQDDNYALLVSMNDIGTTNPTPPSGWTLLAGADSGGNARPVAVYGKVLTGSESGWQTVPDNTEAHVDLIICQGVDTSDPLNSLGTVYDEVYEASPSEFEMTGPTTDAADCLVVVAVGGWQPLTIDLDRNGTDMTEAVSRDGEWDGEHVYYGVFASPGATGTFVAEPSTTTDNYWTGVSVALNSEVQEVALSVDDATHAHAADSPTLTQHHVLSVGDATHAHTADAPTLTQSHALAVDNASHGHEADAPALTQAHTLAVDDAEHGHEADSVALAAAATLEVDNASHGHEADAPALTQAHTLAVADAEHGHTADNVALSTAATLAVQDATHGHAADAVTVTQAHTLAVDSAEHSHLADSAALTQAHVLAVDDAEHGHTAGAVTLTQVHVLAVAAAVHGHTAEAVVLVQVHTLAVDGALHSHTAELVTLQAGVSDPAQFAAGTLARRFAHAALRRRFTSGTLTR